MKRALSIARLVFLIFAATVAHAQERMIQTDENSPGTTADSPDQRRASPIAWVVSQTHKFWDSENALLFSGVAGARGLDYSSTLNIRRRGLDEALLTNAIVDNHPAFAGIEVAGIAASIGVSYLFHRTGHHRFERLTSVLHIGLAVGGAGRNYAIKTNHSH